MRRITFLMLFLVLTGYLSAQEKGKKIYRATIDADGIQRVEVLAGSYYFDPDYIIVKVNVPVELKVRKEPGITPHNIVIREPDAGIDVRENLDSEPKIIRFTPKKVGKYPFYCDKRFLFFKSHRERGMEGTLEVVE